MGQINGQSDFHEDKLLKYTCRNDTCRGSFVNNKLAEKLGCAPDFVDEYVKEGGVGCPTKGCVTRRVDSVADC
eukprot:1244177-Pyramimonas_sp.AAC.1